MIKKKPGFWSKAISCLAAVLILLQSVAPAVILAQEEVVATPEVSPTPDPTPTSQVEFLSSPSPEVKGVTTLPWSWWWWHRRES